MSIDLDINNYTINDLINFFKLQQNYTNDDLRNNERDMSMKIISSNYEDNYKYDLLNFIQITKNILLAKIQPLLNNTDTDTNTNTNTNTNTIKNKKNRQVKTIKSSNENYDQDDYEDEKDNSMLNLDEDEQIGRIINPRASRPVLQTQHIPKSKINGYNNDSRVTNYVFNTLFRDDFEGSTSTDCTFTLPKRMTNVISLTLSGIQYPNYAFTFSNSKDTTTIYISEDTTGNAGLVVIPEGNYTIDQFPKILEKYINLTIQGFYNIEGPNRYTVTIDPYTHFTTISNSEFTFTINTAKGHFQKCPMMPSFSAPNPKTGISRQTLINTLGYQIGFRQMEYSGQQSYTSESLFDASYTDYVYFILNDFCNNQSSNNYSMFQNQLFDNNILAIIPITTPAFTSTFDNNSNFIYKTRNYFGPVNISKISIKLTNQFGFPINMYSSDYVFCLQTVDIYNNVSNYTSKSVSII